MQITSCLIHNTMAITLLKNNSKIFTVHVMFAIIVKKLEYNNDQYLVSWPNNHSSNNIPSGKEVKKYSNIINPEVKSRISTPNLPTEV